MIRVTIELFPRGSVRRSRVISTIVIANDGTGSLTNGNYDVDLMTMGRAPRIWRKVRVENFPRRRLLVVDLLYRALRAALGDRNPDGALSAEEYSLMSKLAGAASYRKKPVVIEAIRWNGDNWDQVCAFITTGIGAVYATGHDGSPDHMEVVIHTLEGDMRASIGDYIIRGVKGEYYPCKPDIFEATYESAEDVGCGSDNAGAPALPEDVAVDRPAWVHDGATGKVVDASEGPVHDEADAAQAANDGCGT